MNNESVLPISKFLQNVNISLSVPTVKVIPQFCIVHLNSAEFCTRSVHAHKQNGGLFLNGLARDDDQLPFPRKQAWRPI